MKPVRKHRVERITVRISVTTHSKFLFSWVVPFNQQSTLLNYFFLDSCCAFDNLNRLATMIFSFPCCFCFNGEKLWWVHAGLSEPVTPRDQPVFCKLGMMLLPVWLISNIWSLHQVLKDCIPNMLFIRKSATQLMQVLILKFSTYISSMVMHVSVCPD